MKNKKSSLHVHSFLGGSIKFEKGIFDRTLFMQTIEMPFESMNVPISKNYHKMLSQQYGEYWVIPPEEERKCKVHAILVDTEKDYTEYEHYRDGMEFEILTRSIR